MPDRDPEDKIGTDQEMRRDDQGAADAEYDDDESYPAPAPEPEPEQEAREDET